MNTLILIFYRIAAALTRVTGKRREFNFLNNISADISPCDAAGYIENQEKTDGLLFGLGTIKLNGCGPIATFNALQALGAKPDINILLNIIKEYEKKGAAFGARLGTSPFSIKKCIESFGYTTRALTSASRERLETFSNDYDTFIAIIRNDAKSLKAGLHYICITKDGDTFVTHNPCNKADSIYNAMGKCSKLSFKPVYTIGIKNKEHQNEA